MTEEKDEYLNPVTNPMIKLEPDADADEEKDIEPYRAPFGPVDADEVEALATQLLGKSDSRIAEVGDEVEIKIDRTVDGLLTINGRAPGEITDEDRRELMDLQGQDSRKARDEKEASDDRHLNPATNPYVKLEPE